MRKRTGYPILPENNESGQKLVHHPSGRKFGVTDKGMLAAKRIRAGIPAGARGEAFDEAATRVMFQIDPASPPDDRPSICHILLDMAGMLNGDYCSARGPK